MEMCAKCREAIDESAGFGYVDEFAESPMHGRTGSRVGPLCPACHEDAVRLLDLWLADAVGDELTVAEAASELGITRGRVHQLMKAGVLSARRHGGVWLVSSASVKARKESMAG